MDLGLAYPNLTDVQIGVVVAANIGENASPNINVLGTTESHFEGRPRLLRDID